LIEIALTNVFFNGGIVFSDKKDSPVVVSVTGHAGTAPKGEDIVCSAVSALAQTMVLSIRKIGGVNADIEQKSGVLRIEFPAETLGSEQKKVVTVLLESFLIGAGEIMKEHPSSVKIDFK